MLDWRLILGRLRPTSSYHWLGDGVNDTYASIGEWRDSLTTKPTEQECLDEWDVYVVEKTAEDEIEAITASNKIDAEAEIVNSGVAGKTPEEIREYLTAQMTEGGWTQIPVDVRQDLGKWLIMLASNIVWK